MPRRWGLPFKQGFQCFNPPVVPVAPVSPVPKLPWSLPSSRFFLRRGSQPLGSFMMPPPQEASEGCGVFRAPFPPPPRPQTSAARARDRAVRGSYLAAALGLGTPQAGALQTGAHGPCALAGSQRRGTGAEGKLGLRPGWAIRDGGGSESRPQGGGRAGAGERVSERARPAPPVTHRALCLHPLPCAPFSPGTRGPAHLTCRRL